MQNATDTTLTRHVRLFRLLAMGQLLLITLTWPLWIPQAAFPQVPLISWAANCPVTLEWTLVGALIGAQGLVLFARQKKYQQSACLLSVVCQTALTVVDQHRLQPWVWEFMLVSFILLTVDTEEAFRLWRWLVIGIYAWSAWSKIDLGFCLYHGPYLLDGIGQALHWGQSTGTWPLQARCLAAAAIPVFELLIAVALGWPGTRRAGLIGATIMHIGLLLALGPLGHNHRPGVLAWNIFFLAQNWILFHRQKPAGENATSPLPEGEPLVRRAGSGTVLARSVLGIALVWPVFEPFGLCDHWPAWAVYAAKPERVTVMIPEDETSKLPIEMQPYLAEDSVLDGKVIRIDRWSLDAVYAPIYPQDRFQIGVALGLAEQFQIGQMQVVIESVADRWTARRTLRKYDGLESIRALAKSYRLNALPRQNQKMQ